MIDWNIQSRAHACQACNAGFVDKQPYHTLLFDERQGYQRIDVCEACWSAQYSQGASDRKGFISHWQGQYTAPPAAPPDPIQRETAETLLRKLLEQNDPQHAGACYILAVMLERKRLLKVQSQIKQEGRRIFVYEQPKTGDIFTIPDPDLQLDQLEAVQRDVAHLLEHGLAATAPATPEAAPADAGAPTPVSTETPLPDAAATEAPEPDTEADTEPATIEDTEVPAAEPAAGVEPAVVQPDGGEPAKA